MARNRTVVDASPETVFAVLADARRYAYFVVGTKKIRRFHPRWPEPGSAFHHTLGVGLPLIRDATVCLEMDEPHRLVLRPGMRPLAVNETTFRIIPQERGTLVEVRRGPSPARPPPK